MSNCLSKWSYDFTFLPAKNQCSCCPISAPAFGVVSGLGFNLSNSYAVVFPCFNLQFSNNVRWCCHMLIYYHISSLVRYLFRYFSYIFKLGCLIFYCWLLKSSLNILDIFCKHILQITGFSLYSLNSLLH